MTKMRHTPQRDAIEAAFNQAQRPLSVDEVLEYARAQVGSMDPATVYRTLSEAGADIVGVNCSVGPTQMLSTIERMREAAPDGRYLAMPNAGFPERVEGRLSYPSSPEYFGRHVASFLDLGACAVGGCCGGGSSFARSGPCGGFRWGLCGGVCFVFVFLFVLFFFC